MNIDVKILIQLMMLFIDRACFLTADCEISKLSAVCFIERVTQSHPLNTFGALRLFAIINLVVFPPVLINSALNQIIYSHYWD